jgi:hypothetical protein
MVAIQESRNSQKIQMTRKLIAFCSEWRIKEPEFWARQAYAALLTINDNLASILLPN